MPVDSAAGRKWPPLNALGSEVARHQLVTDFADFAFNSRRLHHLTCCKAGT